MERLFLEVCCRGWGGGISRKRCHGKRQPRIAAVLANLSLLGYLLGGQEPSVSQSQPCLPQTKNNSLVSDAAPADTASRCSQASLHLRYRSRGRSVASSALWTLPSPDATGDTRQVTFFPPHHLPSNSLSFARSSLRSDSYTHTSFS